MMKLSIGLVALASGGARAAVVYNHTNGVLQKSVMDCYPANGHNHFGGLTPDQLNCAKHEAILTPWPKLLTPL